jgi:hypothetical protein
MCFGVVQNMHKMFNNDSNDNENGDRATDRVTTAPKKLFKLCVTGNRKLLKLRENGKKLALALIDLKTAETIISILSADLKINNELDARVEVNLKLPEWSTVKCKNGVCNQGKTRNIKNSTCNSVTVNPFAPLEYLEKTQPVPLSTYNEKLEKQTSSTTSVDARYQLL